MTETVRFTINGRQYEVGPNVSIGSRLASFITDQGLKGTRTMCYQGGCGACLVVASVTDPSTLTKNTFAVNSCLAPVYACDGWDIVTVEGLGNRRDGYHVIQDRLADFSGTQCGYCSPGMVMNMYGLTQSSGGKWTATDVERSLDANLCRCTGYRPILDAFKSISVQDIEDSQLVKCPSTGQTCAGQCGSAMTKEFCSGKNYMSAIVKDIVVNGTTWSQPTSLQELLTSINGLAEGTAYRITVGNTGQGVYSDGPFSVYLYTRKVPELSKITLSDTVLKFGADVSLTRVIEEFEAASSLPGFSHLKQIATHWRSVASTSVRNLGCWAGNLVLKNLHKEFPSDIFITLVGAGATVTTALASDGSVASHTVEELVQLDLVAQRRVILELSVPPLSQNVVYKSFKIMPRTVWAHAYVNAAFRFQVDRANAHTVVGMPTIVYGGINPTFVHASQTELLLSGKSLEDPAVVQAAMAALQVDVVPDNNPVDASPEYRLALTQSLLYKGLLGIVSSVVSPTVLSGATVLERPLSSGTQSFDQNTESWPLSQPIPKLEAWTQCSGEAEYINYIPFLPNELYGAFVTSTQANAAIDSIDGSAALASSGVVGFVTAKDIPGQNNIMVFSDPRKEELFPSARCSYYGQGLGLVVATSRSYALAGAAKVKVVYSDVQPPLLGINAALQQPLPPNQPPKFTRGDVAAGFAQSTHIVEGAMGRDGQYHFHMETQVARVIPTEDGLEVFSATQYPTETQASIAQILNIPDHSINVTVRRLGGAYGAKIDRCNIIAGAAALAANVVRQPVRVALDMSTNMTMIGWRDPFLCTYKVGVDDNGILKAVQATVTGDAGYIPIGSAAPFTVYCMASCYSCANWDLTPQVVLTNTPSNTWCRSPSTTEGITFIENILEHVAQDLGLDPLELRRRNLIPDGASVVALNQSARLGAARGDVLVIPRQLKVAKNLINDMLNQLMVSADVDARKTAAVMFNGNNRWKKRGVAVMTMLYPYDAPSVYPFNVIVSVFAHDGSVAISHGGTEAGQGINTKVAQVAAYELGVPLDLISIKPTTSLPNANSQCTGGSLGSDFTSHCVGEACKRLKARLDAITPVIPGETWQQRVSRAYVKGVDLTERHWNGPGELNSYAIFGVCCTEVEVDILTGQFTVVRTDLIHDAGKSMSPLVDIGQVEGAFVMGQGLFTTEKLIQDSVTGVKLSNDTWVYKIPTALDIPVDFRVTLLRNAPNPLGVQSAKATGEPPLTLAFSIVMALRMAIASSRRDAGNTAWFPMDTPITVEKVQQLCLVDPAMFVYN